MKEADFIMAYLKPSTKHRTFTHLNAYQRGQIQVLHQEQRSSREIARAIGCSHQTVLNELRRGEQPPRSAPTIDAFRLIFQRPDKPSMNAIAVIVDAGTNWQPLQLSSSMSRRRSCPQTNGLLMRFVVPPIRIRSGKIRSGSARGRYTAISIADS